MRQNLVLGFFALLFILTSCSSGDDLVGDWAKQSTFKGTQRSETVSFTIDSDKNGTADVVYIGLGFDGDERIQDFYKFDVNKDSWTKIKSFPGQVREGAVAFSANGKGYVGSGFDGDYTRLSDFYEYDPATDNWTKINDIPTAREDAVAFTINNVGYVGTGKGYIDMDDKNDKGRNILKDFYKYENGEWTILTKDFPGEKMRGASVFVINEVAYLCTGAGSMMNEELYSFNGDSWTKLNNLNHKDYNNTDDVLRTNAVSFVIGGKGYIVSGKNGSLKRDVWEYNPKTDRWIEKRNLESKIIPREEAVGFTLEGRGFMALGRSGNIPLDDMWEFLPNNNETIDNN